MVKNMRQSLRSHAYSGFNLFIKDIDLYDYFGAQ